MALKTKKWQDIVIPKKRVLTPEQQANKEFLYNAKPTQPDISQMGVNPLTKKPEIPTTKAKLTAPEIWRDETGKITGVSMPDGKQYLGIKEADVRNLISKYQAETALPGTEPAGTAQAQMERQQQIQRLTQAAQEGSLTPQELQNIEGSSPDMRQAAGAGLLQGTLAGGGAGLAVGAAAGLGVASPITAPVGAAVGLLFGFLNGIRSNIKNQQADQFAADQTALSKGQTMLRALITDTNQNPQNAPENIALFYHTLNMIDAAHAKTWKDSQENLNKFMGNDGTPQLAKFETFDAAMRVYYLNRFETALAQPNPNTILLTSEDLGAETE
jgi:hypothetical protein